MNKKAAIYNNDDLAGYLEKMEDGSYLFKYEENYYQKRDKFAISLTLPKTQMEYRSKTLFPFFFGLLSEGVNKQTQCRLLRIDENDHFGLLLKIAAVDTIGSVTIKAMES